MSRAGPSLAPTGELREAGAPDARRVVRMRGVEVTCS